LAQLETSVSERARLETELAAALAEAQSVPNLTVELASARKLEAQLRQDLELGHLELAATKGRLERVLHQAAELARAHEEDVAKTLVLAGPPPAEAAKTNGPEAYRASGNGGDRAAERTPPVVPTPADATIVGGQRVKELPSPLPPDAAPPVQAPPVRPETDAGGPNQVLMHGASVHACSKLGTLMDEDTRFTFSSADHYCYALPSPGAIEAEHQIAFCLCEAHAKCPIFTGEQKRPALPINTLAEAADGRRRRGRGLGLFGGRK
jgi:hypothetical protein